MGTTALRPIRCAISKRLKPRCLALVAAVLVLGGPATGSQAENLGTVGETYAIAEPHLLSYIEQTLREKEKSGELANLEEQAKSRVVESIRNPKPLAGIRPTQTARTFYFDPSIRVEQNITDAMIASNCARSFTVPNSVTLKAPLGVSSTRSMS